MKPLNEVDLESLPEVKINIFTLRESIKRGVKLGIDPLKINVKREDPDIKDEILQVAFDKMVESRTDKIMEVIINELYL